MDGRQCRLYCTWLMEKHIVFVGGWQAVVWGSERGCTTIYCTIYGTDGVFEAKSYLNITIGDYLKILF